MSHKLLMPLILLISLGASAAEVCTDSMEGKNPVKTCISDNGDKVVDRYFSSDPSKISTKLVYKNGKLVKSMGYSISGKRTVYTTYEHRDSDSSYIETRYFGDRLSSKRRLRKDGENEVVLEEFGFHHRTGELESIDIIEDGITTTRQIIEKEQHTFSYNFIYDGDRIIGFKAFDTSGKFIGDYFQNTIEEMPSAPTDAKVKVAIIDSGFDHQHRDIIDHISVNFNDPIDGIDNDGDGLVDNYIGTFYDEDGNLEFTRFAERFDNGGGFSNRYTPKQFGIPFETIRLNRPGKIDSHGTHVASLALRDLESTALIPFAGDYGDSKYLDLMSKKIKAEKVDFVNMSFSFPHFATGDLPRATLDSLRKLIVNNPDTVFFVAAGNDGRLFNGGRFNCLYPACYQFDNVVTVGSTADSEWRTDGKYEMAEFSNHGANYVDVFAPGTQVNGALLGDMEIRYSGTSMASPIALNIAAKLKEDFPHKTNHEVKDAIFKSALKLKNIDAKYGVIDYESAKDFLLQN